MSSTSVTHDFEQFSSRAYLKEYYSEIGTENAFLLNFFHETHGSASSVSNLLEVGGGPTIYQLISSCRRTDRIVFSEFLPENRREVQLWREADAEAFDWDEYFEYVLRREGAAAGPEDLAARKAELRHKIKAIVPYDARSPSPLDAPAEIFDLISVNFCLESITDNEVDYRFSLERMTELLVPGGQLVMAALKKADYYQVGNLKFPAFPVDENSLDRYLSELAYKSISIASEPAEHSQGYAGMMGIVAWKS